MSLRTVHNTMSPAESSTLKQFISLGISDDMTYDKFSLYHVCESSSNVQLALSNVLYDYWDDIKEKRVLLILTDEEYLKYRYRPKYFAKDIYGSTQLFFIILALNNMYNMKDFNKKRLWVLYPSDLTDLLNKIYSAESNYIEKLKNKL